MTRSIVGQALVSLLLTSVPAPDPALSTGIPPSVTQEQAQLQTFGGKIVSQNAVRFVLRDYDNDVWYHIDDQQRAGNLLGKYVLITGTFDGLTGTIRLKSIAEATPDEISAMNAEKLRRMNEAAKAAAAAAPPASRAGKAPIPQPPSPQPPPLPQADSTQAAVGDVPSPHPEARIAPPPPPLPRSQGEISQPVREAASASLLGLPEEAVTASSTVAITSRRSVKVPPGFDPKAKEPAKDLVVGRLLKRVAPLYPADAEEQRIEGTVRLRALIGEDGRVQSVQPVDGPQLLVGAALAAVREWRYSPTLLEGRPIQVQDDIRLVFRLPN